MVGLLKRTSMNESMGIPIGPEYTPGVYAIAVLVLAPLNIMCIMGNSLVIASVIQVKSMRSRVSNLLIVSLAVSDLLVGVGVMPLAILYYVTESWQLGLVACTAWVTLDVLLCTASILNLTSIAIDKYLCITQPLRHSSWSKRKRIAIYCTLVWGLSVMISITPIVIGWNPVYIKNGECSVNQNIGYQLYATIVAFYFPLGIMKFVYFKMIKLVCAMVKVDKKNRPNVMVLEHVEDNVALQVERSSTVESALDTNNANGVRNSSHQSESIVSPTQSQPQKKHSIKKSIKTLGIIMGLFVACWLPFFILALVRPICNEHCNITPTVTNLLTWLGYVNSCLNPLIYARFHKDFGIPMKEMLFCRWSNVNEKVRKKMFQDQYIT